MRGCHLYDNFCCLSVWGGWGEERWIKTVGTDPKEESVLFLPPSLPPSLLPTHRQSLSPDFLMRRHETLTPCSHSHSHSHSHNHNHSQYTFPLPPSHPPSLSPALLSQERMFSQERGWSKKGSFPFLPGR